MKKLKFKLDALQSAEVLTREQLKNVLRSSVGGTSSGFNLICLCGGVVQRQCNCNLTNAQCCNGYAFWTCNHC